LIELMLVISVLMVALLVLSQSMGTAMTLTDVNRETALASDGARDTIELLQGVERFQEVFAIYNTDPADDPAGPGTAPGAAFSIAGLQPADDDPDGMVGEIRFPAVVTATGLKISEEIDDAALGMPRDLSGDGLVDSADHSLDYLVLPVRVRVEWTGSSGPRNIEVVTLLARELAPCGHRSTRRARGSRSSRWPCP
jgi:hypothetical protein